MIEPELPSQDVIQAAAAVLVLIDGAESSVVETMRGMASEETLASIERVLKAGDREARARAIATPLGRIALALDGWRLR
jgi:hypothetical protein